MQKNLSTEPYKGTRDFYPEDMAIQRYIFDTWAKTAEPFGFERYDASILEPAELYKSKGAENEELVNEQTYTFTDRGDREVTLRPEMTPTVARMVAHKRRELSFPVRWFSIPNLFRYERPQRGRLREHWQLNCDMFGVDHYAADVEMIALAANVLKAFGAQDSDFEIRINDRKYMEVFYASLNLSPELMRSITRLNDRKNKISKTEYHDEMVRIVQSTEVADSIIAFVEGDTHSASPVVLGLAALGITNVRFDASLARGFDYYTGTIFEIFDTAPENNRAILGGGRYDNLTGLFGGDAVSGIGFGMGDVTMRDFLETHDLLKNMQKSDRLSLVIIPENGSLNIEGEKIAQKFRMKGVSVSVDISTRKFDKKKSSAQKSGSDYMIAFNKNNVSDNEYTLRALSGLQIDKTETLEKLINHLA